MRIITEKGLRRNLGENVRIEREGLIGNCKYIDGRVKEGMLLGILEEDENGFHVKMFNSHWEEDFGNVFDRSSFMDEPYRLQDRDWIGFPHGSYLVRL